MGVGAQWAVGQHVVRGDSFPPQLKKKSAFSQDNLDKKTKQINTEM